MRPREKRYTVTDGHGLTLRVHPTGVKSWCLRISYGGVVTDLSLGRWPEVSLMQARQQARRKRKAIGQEPPRGYVLQDAFRLWCNLKRGRIVSYMDEKRRLERYVISPLGRRQLDEITAPLIIATVRHIEAAGHQATLKRVLMRTREIMDLAVCAGYILHNPIARVSRVFAAPIVRPMPSISWQSLPDALAVVKCAPLRLQVLFLWSLASMLRPGETAKLRKDWIDGDTLSIPASEMKKGRLHRVPLTDFMRHLLAKEASLSPHPRSSYVFAGRDPGSHISSQALAKYLHGTTLTGKLVAHGLRSMARCWMADMGTPFEVAEACLSHVSGSQVSRAYQRSDYLDARRAVMQSWSDFIEHCARSAGLMPLLPEGISEDDRS